MTTETHAPEPEAAAATRTNAASEVREFILERWQNYGVAPEQYPWIWEAARWHELAFCLIARAGAPDIDAGVARDAVGMLAKLGLLRIDMLAELATGGQELDPSHPDVALLGQLLERVGVAPERAQAIVTTLAEAARGLVEHHDGKVQRYLRHYGAMMLDELGETFAFTRLSDEDARYAWTHWLQNALDMPLPLSDPHVRKLCQARGITVEELVAVADGLDLNVALLDDILSGTPREKQD